MQETQVLLQVYNGKCDNSFEHHFKIMVAQLVKNLPAMWETSVQSLSREDPLEKGMATHSSILAGEIPWTEEPRGLQSLGSQKSDTTELLTLSYFQYCQLAIHVQFLFHLPYKHYSVPSSISVSILYSFALCGIQNVIETRLTPLSILAIFSLAVVSNSIEESVITLNTF